MAAILGFGSCYFRGFPVRTREVSDAPGRIVGIADTTRHRRVEIVVDITMNKRRVQRTLPTPP
jgi:hypothetical protein